MSGAPSSRAGHPTMERLTRRKDWRAASVVALVISLAITLFHGGAVRLRLDALVYQIGGARFASGDPLYNGSFPTGMDIDLPFTYPPLAAVLFSPLASLTPQAVSVLVCFVSTAALLAGVWIAVRAGANLSAGAAVWTAIPLSAVFLALGPVYMTMYLGQINLLLLILVLADWTIVPRRFRGLLTGLAVSIKLTPAVFGFYPLLRRDVASIVRMGVSVVGFTGLAWILAPSDSSTYWTQVLRETGRIGQPFYTSNQSVTGELWRLSIMSDGGGALWWIGAVLLIFAATVLLMLRLLRQGKPVLALTVNALFGLLASPVSWTHHWVWGIVVLIVVTCLLIRSTGDTWGIGRVSAMVLVVLGIVALSWNPQDFLTYGHGEEFFWGAGFHIIGNSYLWWGLLAYPLLWASATALPTESPVVARSS